MKLEYYYYMENGQQLGPFTLEELKYKRIKKSMLLWKEGMIEWAKAETFDELIHIILSEPPPIIIPEIIIGGPVSISKFDLTYKREWDAVIIGICVILISLGIGIIKPFKMDTIASYKKAKNILIIIDLILRFGIVYWIIQISRRQNRNQTKWGIIGLFFPSLSLVVIGLNRKLKYKIKIDKSLTKIEQFKKLKNDAETLNKESRKSEAKIVYQYIFENYIDFFEDYLKYGILLFELEEYSEAELIFLKIKNQSGLIDDVTFYLGFIKVKNGEFEKAKTILRSIKNHHLTKSQSLLHTLIQVDLDYLNDELLTTKYGLYNEIARIERLDILEGQQSLNLTTLKKLNCSLHLYENGIKFIFKEDSWKKKEHLFFASICFIKTIERTDGNRFEVKFKNDKLLTFSLRDENSYQIDIQKIIDKFKKVCDNFFH
jgi:hypothetical protein